MDSITHIALGACMGEAFAGKKLGKKALLWGALAQSVPDIDFVASLWMRTSDNLLAHRGFTHSILFCVLVTPLLAFLAEYWHRPHNISLQRWLMFFGGVIAAHIFMDAFNNYGVGWLEPFSHYRVSFNAIYVADPFFSLWPGIACILLILVRRRSRLRKSFWMAGLGLSAAYLAYCLVNKAVVNTAVKEILARRQISYTHYFTTPAPLQSWLWYVVAGTDSGYYTGYRSVFDHGDTMTLHYFPRNDRLLAPLANHADVQDLVRFSKKFYTLTKNGDTLLFHDLRFGQIAGWHNPEADFVFYYYLQPAADNTLVVQRGRFEGWNATTFESLWKRARGN